MSVEEIVDQFRKYSSKVCVKKMEQGDFDYVIYFEDGQPDEFLYCLKDGGKFKWDKEKYPGLAEYIKYGPMAYTAKLRNGLFRNTGACLSPQNAFLNQIGMETLGLRMERQCDNAYELAGWIEENYPGV